MKKTVILLLIIGLLTQVTPFTISDNLACDANPLRAVKSTMFASDITDFTDNVYEIGNCAMWITQGTTTSLFEIILLRNDNTYKIHAIGSDLSLFNQTYVPTTPTELLGVIDHIAFVKEFSADLQSFKFAAYLFDTTNLAGSDLKRVLITPLTYPAGDKREGLAFSRLLSYDASKNLLAVVMTNGQYTEIQTKVLSSNGPFEAQIPVTNAKTAIAVGNSKLLFDGTSKTFYRFFGDGANFNQLPAKTSPTGSEFGPFLYSNLQYFKLIKDTFAIASYAGTQGSITASFGIFDGSTMIASMEDNDGVGTFVPVIHSNNYNFMFISESVFSFCRYNSKNIFSSAETLSLTVAEMLEAKADFKDAFRVSFNVEKQFILTDKSIIIYELSYNTAGDQVTKMNKLASISLSSQVAGLIKDDSSKWIKLRIKCSCAKVLVTKLKCFSTRFKCLGINSYIPDDCSTPYIDNVPEFATAAV